MKLHDMRKEFGSQLDEELELPESPFETFQLWFQEARKLYRDDANCFVLSTANAQGTPSSRVVLLIDFSEKGLSFFTNYTSVKAKNIQENPEVACLFYWSTLEKQIRIKARAKVLSKKDSETYFHERPRNSQIAAWASKQSKQIESKRELVKQFLDYKEEFKEKEKIPYPEFWGGYLLVPEEFEFWQGGLYRLHDRIVYTKKEGSKSWQQSRLSP